LLMAESGFNVKKDRESDIPVFLKTMIRLPFP